MNKSIRSAIDSGKTWLTLYTWDQYYLLLPFFKFRYHDHFSPCYLKVSVEVHPSFLLNSNHSFLQCPGLTKFCALSLRILKHSFSIWFQLIVTSVFSLIFKVHEPVSGRNSQKLVLGHWINFLTHHLILSCFHQLRHPPCLPFLQSFWKKNR